jgi:hypothetical protein
MKHFLIVLLYTIFSFSPLLADTIFFNNGMRMDVEKYKIKGRNLECFMYGGWHPFPLVDVKKIVTENGKESNPYSMPEKKQEAEKEEMVHLIILKNGNNIIAKEIWNELHEIQYMKYGALVSIKRNTIEDIKYISKNEALKYNDSIAKDGDKNEPDKRSSLDSIAKESRLRALKAKSNGYPAQYVKIGMTKAEVVEIAGHPNTTTSVRPHWVRCKENYDILWRYNGNYQIGFKNDIVVCNSHSYW